MGSQDSRKMLRPSKLTEEEKKDILARILAKDPSVFPLPEEAQEKIKERLGWVDAPQRMRPHLPAIKEFASKAKEKFQKVILCGMGGSSLFPLALSKIFGPEPGWPAFHVIDTTDPEEIEKVEKECDLAKTLFIIASKSGTTIETTAHFRYFWEKVKALKENPGENFAAITDEGTPLHLEAQEKNFCGVFLNPKDIGGRYAALTFVGLLPAALMGLQVEKFLESAEEMQQSCSPDIPWEYNPAAWLSEYLAERFFLGQDKLTILADPLLRPFSLWIEQLVAESLGKEFTGIIPVVGETPGSPTVYGPDRIFVYLGLRGRQDLYRRLFSDLKEAGFPLKLYWLPDRYDLGAECFRWELAVALCGVWLGLNPFDEPDVIRAKNKTKEVLETFKQTGNFPVEFYVDDDLEVGFLYAGGLKVQYPRLRAVLKKFLYETPPWGYFAFLPFLPYDTEIEEIFTDLRTLLRGRRQCSTIMGFGPRYLHSIGQLFKGGPRSGRFVIFTRKGRKEDQLIPEFGFTFWDLQFAQAYGDFQALAEDERPVIHIHLTENYKLELKKFYNLMEEVTRLTDEEN
ncbi:phosphoglucose isomerase [Thermodesulfatator atlanticus]|uniref:phosphoglucose isomerase n=1 Tax=Thermodesulfatator atlanticus TaxID=501497 RepID=UPI0003B3B896|nr:phosphoglucose isomerase [Thermodesulfatator atlanticus]